MLHPVETTPIPLPALYARAMRAADRHTIDRLGLPGFTLMETAGRAVALHAVERYRVGTGSRVLCVCGKGNNGGDGLVAARVLHAWGADVRVLLADGADAFAGDVARHYALLDAATDALLRIERWEPGDALPSADLCLDALLGTGLDKPLRAPYDALVEALNAHPAPTLAVDVPTGLDSDTGAVHGTAVRAASTVSMGALKAGLLVGHGPEYAGELVVAEIGIPLEVMEAAARKQGVQGRVASDRLVGGWLPRRSADAYKYSVGQLLAVVGSPDVTGAPVLACQAAARAGAGAVVCATAERARPIVAAQLREVMHMGLPEGEAGLDAEAATEALAARLERSRALLVGCGLGREAGTQQVVRRLLSEADLPAVVDADGIHALAAEPDVLRHAHGRWVLTPHVGEFRALAGDDVRLDDRVTTAVAHARKWQVVLVLKGAPTLVACPDGRVYIGRGDAGVLATAGTGDVLAGVIAGLLAQGMPPDRAAIAGVHLGMHAARWWTARHDGRTLLAGDLIEALPDVMERLPA